MIKAAFQINGKKMDYSINDDGQLASHGEKKSWICVSHCIPGYIIKELEI